MLPMDDEELTQDVLDQFDFVCTQYTVAPEVSNNDVSKNRNRSKTSGRTGGFKLSKTSSLDANTSRCPELDLRQHQQKNDEVQHLRDEIASLKEELYMKVGELSSLKEASSRSAAANMETVRKLKMQLASEREEARKTMAALGSQLAFREADYQLVASELAQAKEAVASQAVAFATDASNTAAVGILTLTDTSPASALLISMASQSPSDSKTFAEPASHNLPVVVTPVPSRRSRRQAVWNNELGTQQQYSVPDRASRVPNVVLLNRNDNKCSPEAKPSVRRAVRNAETPGEKTITGTPGAREGGPQRTPCKRSRTDTSPPTSTHSNRTPVVSSLSPPFQPRHGLRHRCKLEAFIRCRGSGDNGTNVTNPKQKRSASFSTQLVRNFAHLASLAPSLPLSELDPSQRGLNRLIEDSVSAFASSPEVEFFHGLSILSQLPQSVGTRSPCSADRLASLCQALTHLLRLIRNRLNRYFDFFFRYRTEQGGFGCLSSNASASASKQDLSTSRAAEETSITTDTSSSPMELSDDPFAGAPASQVVPIPSSTPSNKQQSATSTPSTSLDLSFLSADGRTFPASHWISFCASLSISGVFACLQQLLLLIQAFSTSGDNNQRPATALREVASLVGWTISSVAHLLIGPSNRRGPDGRALRDLRPGWTRELTALAEFSIYLASLLSPELTSEVDLAVCNSTGPSSPYNSCWWPPSVSAVLIIADQVMRTEGKEDNKKVEASAEGTRRRCQQKRPSRLLPTHVLAPLLRLLGRLVEGGQLPAFGHEWFNDASSTHITSSWWCPPESALPGLLESSRCASEAGAPNAEFLLNDLLTRVRLLRVAGVIQPERITALENCILRQLMTPSQSARESSLQHQLGCPLSLLCKLILAHWKQRILDPPPSSSSSSSSSRHRLLDEVAFSGPVRKCCALLTEFSSLITALLVKHQLPASSSCTCTVEVYSTLITLGVSPTKWLFRLSSSTTGQRLTAICLAALGQLMQTLQGLLLEHGDDAFQSFTDRVPAFFCVISNLSRWCRHSSQPMEGENTSMALSAAYLLHPKLVEELNDFDSSVSEVHTVTAQTHTQTCL